MEKKKKTSKLALSFVFGFLILGLLISTASSIIGYSEYKSGIEELYNTKGYEVAESVEQLISKDMLKEYREVLIGYEDGTVSKEQIDALIAEDRYQDLRMILRRLAHKMGTNDIYVAYLDYDELCSFNGTKEGWTPLHYMFDNYLLNDEDMKNGYAVGEGDLSFVLGDKSGFNEKFIDEVKKLMETGKRSDSYFISNQDFGYITSAIHPVCDTDGSVIAIVGVETPMPTIESSLRSYLIRAVATTVGLIILIIVVYVLFLYRRVIIPIDTISSGVSGFIENNNRVSTELSAIHTGDEIQTLAESTLQMQIDINEYINNITRITAEKERIGAELDVAAHIQASMLPCIFPAFPDREEIDIYATMDPAKEVGGDFYDFFMVDERHLAVVVADVSGKGVPAALFMVIGKTLIKDHTTPGCDLGEVFSTVNDLLNQANSEGLFITAFEGVLDLVTGEFNFVNAGHEMPFIYRVGGDFECYRIKPGFVLAGMEGMRYRGGSLTLNEGDKIFQYTDGVTEATDASNELYGMERLTAVLNRVKTAGPFEILPAVKADIDAFVGDAPQFDDITMLALEFRKKMTE